MRQHQDLNEIEQRLRSLQGEGLRLFATSSFQSGSVVLLHLLSRLAPEVPVYFLNTGYHFPETLVFRDRLAERLGLRLRELFSPVPRCNQRDGRGRLLFLSDPETCCRLNKEVPLDPVLAAHDVWISGIRAEQSAHRSRLDKEAPGPHGVLRYHPLLHWIREDVALYRERHSLPLHPLDPDGTASIGCAPCTHLESAADGRNGRWHGLRRTECGLHTRLAGARS